MYDVYLDTILLPVAPSKMQIKVNNQNTTVNLINEGEINILKLPGLMDINLTVLIPQVEYPFARYKSGFQGAEFFIDAFEKLKTDRDNEGKLKPFQFIVSRTMPNGTVLYSSDKDFSNITVSLEDYTVNEDYNEGFDFLVTINLKQYKSYGTKTGKITS